MVVAGKLLEEILAETVTITVETGRFVHKRQLCWPELHALKSDDRGRTCHDELAATVVQEISHQAAAAFDVDDKRVALGAASRYTGEMHHHVNVELIELTQVFRRFDAGGYAGQVELRWPLIQANHLVSFREMRR